MTHGSLFSGIGGFDLAAEWMGWENKFHCEWNDFGQKVLKHYWPNAESFTDITKTHFTKYANRIDILTGGFPCQPYSLAGKRKGKEDERHLWPEMLRAIREIQPRWALGENVFGLINWSNGLVFHEVQTDLEAEGYEVWSYVLPACSVNAPHRRDRVWFVAYRNGNGFNGRNSEHEINAGKTWINAQCNFEQMGGDAAYAKRKRRCGGNSKRQDAIHANTRSKTFGHEINWGGWPTKPPLCFRDDGLSSQLDGITFPKWRNESIKAAGNAIVPQVALQIFKAIEQYEQNH